MRMEEKGKNLRLYRLIVMGEKIQALDECLWKHEAQHSLFYAVNLSRFTLHPSPPIETHEMSSTLQSSKCHFVVDFKIGVKQLCLPFPVLHDLNVSFLLVNE